MGHSVERFMHIEEDHTYFIAFVKSLETDINNFN